MTSEGLLKILEKSVELIKKGELSLDDFYEIYKEQIENQERKITELTDSNDNYRKGNMYFKREIFEMRKKLNEIEANYLSFYENKGRYDDNTFEKQIKREDMKRESAE
jgi:hypothetical protein